MSEVVFTLAPTWWDLVAGAYLAVALLFGWVGVEKLSEDVRRGRMRLRVAVPLWVTVTTLWPAAFLVVWLLVLLRRLEREGG